MDLMLYRNVATLITTSRSFSGTMVKTDREMGTLEERRAEHTLGSVSLKSSLGARAGVRCDIQLFFLAEGTFARGCVCAVWVLLCVCVRARALVHASAYVCSHARVLALARAVMRACDSPRAHMCNSRHDLGKYQKLMPFTCIVHNSFRMSSLQANA